MKFLFNSILLVFVGILTQFSSFASIYEAETADLYKAIIETKNSEFSGESYINFDNELGSFLELKIGMASEGEQTIKIRFANGTASARPMKIELNNLIIYESLYFESTNDWTQWDTISITAFFSTGINILKCTSIGTEGGPNIDLFDISG